jgi:hypothetical protein
MSRNKKSLCKHQDIRRKPVLGGVSCCPVYELGWLASMPSSPPAVFEATTCSCSSSCSYQRSQPHTRRYGADKGRSASVAFFVMMDYSRRRDSRKEAISVYRRFSFSFPSFLISFCLSSSATVNSADFMHSIQTDLSPSPWGIRQVTENASQCL